VKENEQFYKGMKNFTGAEDKSGAIKAYFEP
jgi:hypothetical protein